MTWRSAFRRLASGLAALGLLAGCATPKLEQDTTRLSGRLGIVVEGRADRSFSAGFELVGRPGGGRMTLTNPLGLQIGEAQWQGAAAELVTSDGVRRYPSLEALAEDLMGEPVPIEALLDWLRGLAWARAEFQTLAAPAQGFEQLGWRIDTSRQQDKVIVAVRLHPAPKVTVRARLDNP